MADATQERLAYARRVMDEVQRTWLRLPWSSPLQNLSPVALLNTLELYAGDTPADSPARDFRSPSRAIRGALANVSVALLIGEAEPSPAPAADIFSEELPGCSPIVLGIVVAVILFLVLISAWIWIAL